MKRIASSIGISLALAASFVVALRGAVRGGAPQIVHGAVATAVLIALVASTFRVLVVLGPCATDERGKPRPLLRRHGFWVVAIGAVLALPTLGAFGLLDPWETHYAEVAREMVERRERPDAARSPRTLARVLLLGAGLVAFALVSAMRTKFHHYVLVAVPPLAMIARVFVDERLSESARGRARSTSNALLLVASAGVVALVARDVVHAPTRFIHLFTYRYDRHWPSTATFAGVLVVAAIAAAIALLAAGAARRIRRHCFAGLAAASVVLSALFLDRYLPPCAADGGQRGVIAAYYRDAGTARAGPLVAYQLNWKGENFYTGNDVASFISSGTPMKTYLARRADRTVYFVTERGRVATLRGELGAVRSFAELTGPDVSHEFVLVRAEL